MTPRELPRVYLTEPSVESPEALPEKLQRVRELGETLRALPPADSIEAAIQRLVELTREGDAR